MAPMIRTIGDFTSKDAAESPRVRQAAADLSARNAVETSSDSAKALPFVCAHIPTLKSSDQAKAMLLRISREFQPIIARRNYNVLSITEMCCCGDGLDHEASSSSKRRKRRIMGSNVLGYNMTTFSGGRRTSRIHIRLRHAADHDRFFAYEDVAGTLAHELAHCEYGKHDQKFYKLMDEILDEHAALMASSLRNRGAAMSAFSGIGNRLGSSATVGLYAGAGNRLGGVGEDTGLFAGVGSRLGGGGNENDPRKARGYKLGGDSTFTVYMTPAEAAVAAAEARRRQQQLRLRGDRCCKPCVIDISDEEVEEGIEANEETKPPAKRRILQEDTSENRPLRGAICIDLTNDETPPVDKKPAAKDTCSASIHAEVAEIKWNCRMCTFENRPMALACEMCTTERNYRP